jgi:hypothetical protein
MPKQYRKAIKNYTTKVPVSRTLSEIQAILLDFGATGIGYEYEGDGRIKGVYFRIPINGNDKLVQLPVRLKNIIQVLTNENVFRDDDHAYRVAFRNLKDWLDAQFALLETEMVEFPEIFLPYMVNGQGKTLYDVVKNNNYLLPQPT